MSSELSNSETATGTSAKRRRRLLIIAAIAAILLIPTAVWAAHNASDVPDTDWAHDDVAWLYEKGLTNGCAAGLYCPDGNVTRREMAAFTHREQLYLGTRANTSQFEKSLATETDTLVGTLTIDVPNAGGSVHLFGNYSSNYTGTSYLGVVWLEFDNPSCDGTSRFNLGQYFGTYAAPYGAGTLYGSFGALAEPVTKTVNICAWTTDPTTMWAELTAIWVASGADGGNFDYPVAKVDGPPLDAIKAQLKAQVETPSP